MIKFLGIIQARMSSTRLPGKVLLPLNDKTVLGSVVYQLSFSKKLNGLVVTTSNDKNDDILVNWLEKKEIKYFRGNLNDVLDRFYQTARHFNAENIVRITADCPLIDPEVVDNIISMYESGQYDYVSNINPPTFPDGLDAEVFGFSVLEKAWAEAGMQSEREHVTPFIRNHPELFSIGNLMNSENYSSLRWTLDNQEDYDFISEVYKKTSKKDNYIHMKEVIELLKIEKKLTDYNKHITRNEGYYKSLINDREIK